jgi:hypothetical protein
VSSIGETDCTKLLAARSFALCDYRLVKSTPGLQKMKSQQKVSVEFDLIMPHKLMLLFRKWIAKSQIKWHLHWPALIIFVSNAASEPK